MRLYSGFNPFKFLVFLPFVLSAFLVTMWASYWGRWFVLIGIPGFMGAAGLILAWTGLLSDVPECKGTTIVFLCAGLVAAPFGLIMAIKLLGTAAPPGEISYPFVVGEGIILYSILALIFLGGLSGEAPPSSTATISIKKESRRKWLFLPIIWTCSIVIIFVPPLLYSRYVQERYYSSPQRIRERAIQENKFRRSFCEGNLDRARKALDNPSVVQDAEILWRSLDCLKQNSGNNRNYSVGYHPARVPLLLDAILIHEKLNGIYSFAGCTTLQTKLLLTLHDEHDNNGLNSFEERNLPFHYCFRDSEYSAA